MKKVLITSRSFGQVSENPIKILENEGFEIEFYNTSFDEYIFRDKLSKCDALIIGAHLLSEEAIKGASDLKIICKHGAGLDNINLDVTNRYHIKVDNVPAVNSNAVADLTFSLILDVARKTSLASLKVKEGIWEKVTGVDVYGKNLSLIGFGQIGRNVAKRAEGFSMSVFVYDPFIKTLPEEFKRFVKLVSLEEALRDADFLSLHIPLNDDSRNFIDQSKLNMMKAGSFIINTSRGGIINEKDLIKALEMKHIAGAGLDVIENEPINKDNPLAKMENVIITPHIGMYSFEAINAVSMIAAQQIADFFKTGDDGDEE